MQAKRWQQIESLYYQAIKLAAAEREMFLVQVCEGDEALFNELQTLLAFHEENSFLEKPLFENADAAEQLSKTRPNELASGRQFGIYKVIMLLGAGGMGEVYLAEDTRLGRKVALKILPPNLVHNAFLVNRFQQEARATSALNHPNVLTIYEVGQDASGIHFIAAEYIDGETLRQILSSRRELNLAEILDIALQTAAALAAVHETGVIHRDVKPQNIMVRRDGYVKVLDFGIAKLIGRRFSNSENALSSNTETGMILGTAHYMSPEQARGLKVNAQTDLWSFGVTLYEMVTKQVPFAGATTSDIIVSILEREPPALAKLVPDAPPESEQIIKRCLSKDVSARYQNAAEIVKDLQDFQQQIQKNGGFVNLARQPVRPKNRTTAENNQQATVSGDTLPQPQSRWFKARTQNLKNLNRWKVLSAAFVIALTSFVIGTFFVSSGKNKSWIPNLFAENSALPPFEQTHINRLTNSGNVILANLSPDGKYLAYVIFEAGQQSLWLRQIAAPPARLILPSSGDLYRGVSFSPDSNFIYYVIHEKSKGRGMLYAIPTFGGEPRRILEDIVAPPAFAPDGKRFAFLRGTDNDGEAAGHALIIADSGGAEIKTLSVYRDPDFFSLNGFAWSNDGQSIFIAITKTIADAPKSMQLVEIKVSDGSEKVFSSPPWKDIGRIVALKNGDLAVTATGHLASIAQIYQVSTSNGEIKAVTRDLNGYGSVSTAADSKVIAAVQSERISHIWTAETDHLDQMKRITPGVGRYYWTSWTPDENIIYMSDESGNQDVWMMNADGGNPKRLTFDPADDSYPKVTPDNRYIIFGSNRNGEFNLWRMDPDGANPVMLSNGSVDKSAFSLDNNFIYYTAPVSNSLFLSKVSIENGATANALNFPSMHGTISPDGKSIICSFLDERTNAAWQIGVASIAAGKIVKTFKIPTDLPWQIVRWTADGSALTYLDVRDGIYNLWSVKINESQPEQLTHFNSSDQILYYDWSPDGKHLVCLRGQRTSDVVLLNALPE